MFGIGGQELILILVVALLVFGPKRLPELARSLGKGLGEFRRASNDLRQSLNMDPPPPSQTIRPPTSPAQAGAEDPVEAPEPTQTGAEDPVEAPEPTQTGAEDPVEAPEPPAPQTVAAATPESRPGPGKPSEVEQDKQGG